MRSSVKEINKNQSRGLTLDLNPNKYSVLVIFPYWGLLAVILLLSISNSAIGAIINAQETNLLQSTARFEQQTIVDPFNTENANNTERKIGESGETPLEGQCHMVPPSGYRSIGGASRIGPYPDLISCESVNAQYFNSKGSCSCTGWGGG